MPFINISTSAKVADKDKLLKEISILISSLTNKSQKFVMARLEDQGYLHSPHTSSGRIPTDRGLKLFVDGLLELGDLTIEERQNIEARCSVAGKTLLEVLDHSSKELAGLSNCTSLVFAPNNIDRPLKHVEFVWQLVGSRLSSGLALLHPLFLLLVSLFLLSSYVFLL